MKGHGAKFERKKDEVVAAILSTRTLEEAARMARISLATLTRWMKLPEFETAYREARRVAYGQAIARLQQGSSAAVTVLLKVMVDPASPASVRVRAADSVLDHSKKNIELEDFEARLAELERAAKAQEGTRR